MCDIHVNVRRSIAIAGLLIHLYMSPSPPFIEDDWIMNENH